MSYGNYYRVYVYIVNNDNHVDNMDNVKLLLSIRFPISSTSIARDCQLREESTKEKFLTFACWIPQHFLFL